MCLLAKIKSLLCRFMLVGEFCHRCGIQQPLVWWCEGVDHCSLWAEVAGPHGILCPKCFDRLARKRGIAIRFLATEEYRFNQQRG